MVGGFVQQQHVRLGEQQAAQSHAAFFTPGELADDGVPGGQTQRVGRDFQQMVRTITCTRGSDDGFELGLFSGQGVEIGVFFSVSGIHLFEAGLRFFDLAHATLDRLAHRVLGVELRLLGQIPNLQARHWDGFALDLFVDARHDFEQGGLAGAVGTQHANLGAGEEGQGNVFQDLTLGRHDLADAVHTENVLSHLFFFRGADAIKRQLSQLSRSVPQYAPLPPPVAATSALLLELGPNTSVCDFLELTCNYCRPLTGWPSGQAGWCHALT